MYGVHALMTGFIYCTVFAFPYRWYDFLSHQADFAAVKAKLPKVEPGPSAAAVEKGGAKKEKQKDEGLDKVPT